jgi:hypothetical protein
MDNKQIFDAKALFGENTLVRLNIRAWTAKRQAPPDEDTKKDGRHGKFVYLVDPKHLSKVTAVASSARGYLADKGEAFVLGAGVYLVPNTLLQEVMGELENFREEFLDAVEDFIDGYNGALEESRAVLSAKEMLLCPSKAALPQKFDFRYGRFIVALPDEVSSEEVKEWQTTVGSWMVETSGLLALKGYELVRHSREMLADTNRRLFDSLVLNVVAWSEEVKSKRSCIGKKEALEKLAEHVGEEFRKINLPALRADKEKRVTTSVVVGELLKEFIPVLPEGDDVAM